MTTIKNVADHAGVSIATVSRVLSRPEAVAPATRQHVQKSIDTLAYSPNFAAKSLRTARASKILITVPDISNPFFASVIQGAEEAAMLASYSIVLGNTLHDPAREESYGHMLRQKEVDGLIFLGHHLPSSLIELITANPQAPIVNGCEYSSELPVTSVHINNLAAAREAMDYLYALGHTSIGVITGPLASPISRDRLAGVREAAEAAGQTQSLHIAVGDFSIESGEREARAMLTASVRPTALFCFGDEMALGTLSAIRAAGLDCPGSISVLGFDDIRFARFSHPPLSTICQPTHAIGREAVRLLLDVLAGRITRPTPITLPHQLIVRGSTRSLRQKAARIDDPVT